MTLVTYACDAGPEGAAATAANTGAQQFSTPSGGSAVFRAAAAVMGPFGVRITNAANQQGIARYLAAAANNQMAFTTPVRIPTTSGDVNLVSYRHASGVVSLIRRTAAGALTFWRTNVDQQGTMLTAAQATPGTYFRIKTVLNTTTGAFSIKVYDLAGNQVGSTVSGTAALGSTNPLTGIDIGIVNVASSSHVVDFDHPQLDDGATTEIPDAVNQPPTATITGNQNVAAGAAVTASVSATDPDGAIASYAWSVVAASSSATPTLTNAGTAQVSLTAPAAGNLVTLQCVVTDSSGAATTVTTEVRVPVSGDATTLPIAGSGAAWTNVGATNGGTALGDVDDATYVESPTFASTASARRYRLQPMTARTALTLTARLSLSASGAATLVARLFEGTTQRQQWTLTPGTSIANQDLTVDNPSAITDWGNLWLEYSVQAA